MSPVQPRPAVYLLFAVLGGASGCQPGAILAEVGCLAHHGQVSLAISGIRTPFLFVTKCYRIHILFHFLTDIPAVSAF